MSHAHPLTLGPESDYKLGICPVCNRRLTTECHRTEESELWLAAHLVAETNVSISDNEAERLAAIMQWIQQDEETMPINYVDSGKVLRVMDPPTAGAMADAAFGQADLDWRDERDTRESERP